jgi:hypothetical protein
MLKHFLFSRIMILAINHLYFIFGSVFLLTSVKNKRLEFEEDKTEIKYNNLDSA